MSPSPTPIELFQRAEDKFGSSIDEVKKDLKEHMTLLIRPMQDQVANHDDRVNTLEKRMAGIFVTLAKWAGIWLGVGGTVQVIFLVYGDKIKSILTS